MKSLTDPSADLTLQGIAVQVGVSPWHLHRTLAADLGMPLTAYVRSRRLILAAYRLLATPLAIQDISAEAGYDSPAAFSRAFRQLLGTAPRDLRCGARPRGDWPLAPPVPAVVHQPATPVAFVRHYGPLEQVSDAWCALRDALLATGADLTQARLIGVMYDDPALALAGGHVRYDACAALGRLPRPERRLGLQTLPAVDCAVIEGTGEPASSLLAFVETSVRSLASDGLPVRLIAPPYREVFPAWEPVCSQATVRTRTEIHLELLEDAG